MFIKARGGTQVPQGRGGGGGGGLCLHGCNQCCHNIIYMDEVSGLLASSLHCKSLPCKRLTAGKHAETVSKTQQRGKLTRTKVLFRTHLSEKDAIHRGICPRQRLPWAINLISGKNDAQDLEDHCSGAPKEGETSNTRRARTWLPP